MPKLEWYAKCQTKLWVFFKLSMLVSIWTGISHFSHIFDLKHWFTLGLQQFMFIYSSSYSQFVEVYKRFTAASEGLDATITNDNSAFQIINETLSQTTHKLQTSTLCATINCGWNYLHLCNLWTKYLAIQSYQHPHDL